ncbi:hypothetical protein HanPSC8_Chr09g0375041 [Helianthus annuus]|nr:hypothetical protein HanPSC8_Chr09g0375041 [Helianthus annuus]
MRSLQFHTKRQQMSLHNFFDVERLPLFLLCISNMSLKSYKNAAQHKHSDQSFKTKGPSCTPEITTHMIITI